MTVLATGLLHAQTLDGRGGLCEVTAPALDAWTPANGPLWAHFDRRAEDAVTWMSHSSGLDPIIVEALLAEDTRPRVISTPTGAAVILRGVNLNPGAQPDDMISLRMWIDPDRILTMRFPKLAAVNDVRNRLLEGIGPTSNAGVLAALAIGLAQRMGPVVSNVRDLLDDFEERALDGEIESVLKDLGPVRRQTITLKRYLAPQQESLETLIEAPYPWLNDDIRLRLNEALDLTTRFLEDLETLRERCIYIQEEAMALQAQRLNATMYLLSIVSAVFLPLSFLTGILGMNVAGMPGTVTEWAFLAVVGLMVALAVAELLLLRLWGVIAFRPKT
ncbi:MAG: zinc transporter ZntB [Phycisphaeraceae bacterium]